MNPIIGLFVRKYAAGIIARGIQLVGAWLIARKHFSPDDVATISGQIDPTQVVAWCMTVGPELYHAWSNKGHVQATATIVAANNANVSPATLASKGATLLRTAPIVALLLFAGFAAKAQTNLSASTQSNVLAAATAQISLPGLTLGGAIPSNVVTAANDLIAIASPIIPYLTNIHGASIDLDGVYSTGNKLGGLAAFNLAIPGASNYLSMGVAGEYIGSDWYAAPVNVKLGISYTIPWVNIPAYSFTGNGLAVRVRDSAIGDQTLIGEAINVNLGSSWYIIVDVGRIFLTQADTPGSIWTGGVRVGKSF